MKTEVLDHGYIRLVDHMGSDLSVVRSARVSYDADWRSGEDAGSDAKLIRYLMKNRHSTPFESVTMTFEVQAPIFVFRQWHRHRTASYNEVSARYAELPELFYVPRVEDIGVQSKSSKQARNIDALVSEIELEIRLNDIDQARDECHAAFTRYRRRIADGWPRELARAYLPFATYSRMFVTINLWNAFHFLTLRTHEHSQHEIRVFADAMVPMIESIVPVSVGAWRANEERWKKFVEWEKTSGV